MDPVTNAKPFNNDIILKFIIDRKYRILRHLILIMLLGAVFYTSKTDFSDPLSTYLKVSTFSILLSLFYINMYWLVPKFLFKDSYLGYFFWNIVLSLLVVLVGIGVKHYLITHSKPPAYPRDDSNLFIFYFFFNVLIGASAAIKLFQRWIADSQRINEL